VRIRRRVISLVPVGQYVLVSTEVTVAKSEVEAQMIVGMLRSHGIHAKVYGNDVSFRYPNTSWGGVRVMVPDGKAAEARRLIDGGRRRRKGSAKLNAFQRWVVRILGGSGA
jgi:hypothetical protein